jgi:hypothetical protein
MAGGEFFFTGLNQRQTTYVASYHANNGHYSADESYFAAKGVEQPASACPWAGGNGVFKYGSGSVFPSEIWKDCKLLG